MNAIENMTPNEITAVNVLGSNRIPCLERKTLAAHLGIAGSRASTLLCKLKARGLARYDRDWRGWELTPAGGLVNAEIVLMIETGSLGLDRLDSAAAGVQKTNSEETKLAREALASRRVPDLDDLTDEELLAFERFADRRVAAWLWPTKGVWARGAAIDLLRCCARTIRMSRLLATANDKLAQLSGVEAPDFARSLKTSINALPAWAKWRGTKAPQEANL